jgi:hypothetical protein
VVHPTVVVVVVVGVPSFHQLDESKLWANARYREELWAWHVLAIRSMRLSATLATMA